MKIINRKRGVPNRDTSAPSPTAALQLQLDSVRKPEQPLPPDVATQVFESVKQKATNRTTSNHLKDFVDVDPIPTFLDSMRSNNLSDVQAVADLVDNPLEMSVGANNVWISVSPNHIIVADDGCGMDKLDTQKALILGPNKEGRPKSDLGTFGMGLKNASLALGEMFTIITKKMNGGYITAVYDKEDMKKRNKFQIPMGPSSEKEIKYFNDFTHGSAQGTVIIIERLDRLQGDLEFTEDVAELDEKAKKKLADRESSQFKNRLIKHLGETHRIFIEDGRNIFVNGKQVEAASPFDVQWTDEEPEMNDKVYRFKTPWGEEFSIRIRFGFLPTPTTSDARKYGVGIKNQGFYVLRNDRQIMRAIGWLDMIDRHPNLNRLRAEIFFKGEHDHRIVKISNDKTMLHIPEWFRRQLINQLLGLVSTYKQRDAHEVSKNFSKEDPNKEDFKQIEREINSKANRMKPLPVAPKPEPEVEPEEPKDDQNEEKKEGKKRGPYGPRQPQSVSLVEHASDRLEKSRICRFDDLGNGACRIVLNIDHPFYLLYTRSSLPIKEALSKLLLSMGRAVLENSKKSPDVYEIMGDFQLEMGEDLRIQLS